MSWCSPHKRPVKLALLATLIFTLIGLPGISTYYSKTDLIAESDTGSSGSGDDTMSDEAYQDYRDEYFQAAESEYMLEQGAQMGTGIEEMSGKLDRISSVLEKVSAESTDDATVQDAIISLQILVETGLDKMDELQNAVENGEITDPEEMKTKLEAMEDLKAAAEDAMNIVMTWVEENPDVLNSLSDEEQEALSDDEFTDEVGTKQEMKDYLEANYTGLSSDETGDLSALANSVDTAATKDIVQNISEAVMKELLKYMDEASAKNALTAILNSMGALGDKGSTLVQNTTELIATVESVDIGAGEANLLADQPELSDELTALDQLQEECKSTLISSETQSELNDEWTQVDTLLSEGGSEEEFKEKADNIKALLEENTQALVFTDKVAFTDVKPEDNAWYYNELMQARSDGIVDGHDDGSFSPDDDVTKAEYLKMILESKEISPEATSSDENWYDNYVKEGEQFGISSDENWNDKADRETVADWTCKVYGLGSGTDCEETLNDKGIFDAPDSGTGIQNPDDPINRAEVIKVVETTDEAFTCPIEVVETLDQITVTPAPMAEKMSSSLGKTLTK